MNNIIKLSFVGDIMCEKVQLLASKEKGKYNFDKMLEEIRGYLQQSDYVIGNLETPISKIAGYTNDLYCFNTPEEFLKSLKDANFNLLITANNHCLDRGIVGLNKTMEKIKKYNMDYVGTYKNKKESKNTTIKKINGVKVAFIAYTYGTNYSYNRYKLSNRQEYKVNLIKKQNSDSTWKDYLKTSAYKDMYLRQIKSKVKEIIKYKDKRLKINTKNSIVIDELNQGEWHIDKGLLQKAKEDIKKAKENSDIVVFILHSGGQFNEQPGSFTKNIVKELVKEDLDILVAMHPHVVQKTEFIQGKPVIYSLGNFSISPSTPYINFDLLPEYSILLNLYVTTNTKKIEKITFSILKGIEDERKYLKIYRVSELIQKEEDKEKKRKLIQDMIFIYNRVLNTNITELKIQEEYEIKEKNKK